MSQETFIAISGGFDPLHEGHIRYIYDAASFGKVVVLLNSDEWLVRKKGFVFQKFEARQEILEAMRCVHTVIQAFDDDDTVCESIKNLKSIITYFGKGGDRNITNTPELNLCNGHGIPVIFGLGGRKVQSSSEITKNVRKGI